MNIWLFLIGGVYLFILFSLGFRSWKRTKSAEDYILGGSSLGMFVALLTFAATLFSTFTLMGMPDFFRVHGVGAWIFLAISDAAMFFFILWFGFHLRKRAASLKYEGMSGMLVKLYGTNWAGYVFFAGAFLFLIPYVAIQIRGIAIFLNAFFPDALPAWGWSLGIVTIMLMYSELGGLRAIIYCDVFQGTLLLAVIWVIAFGCLRYFGGVEDLFMQVKAVDERLLSTPGPNGLFTPQFLIASFIAILFIPVTQPQVATRLVIVRSSRTMHHMAVGLGIFTFLILIPTAIIGFYGSVKYSGASTAEFLSGVLLHEQIDIIAALVVVGLLAAATSTADSQLFALGTELRSLLTLRGNSNLIYTRIAILSFGAAALVFSVLSSDQLVLLARVSFAGTALMGPMIMAAVFSAKKAGKEIVAITGLGLFLFLLSQLGLVPSMVGPIRLDLLLFLSLGAITAMSAFLNKGAVNEAMAGEYSSEMAEEV
jgi:SSS family solute:Na+ symporter